MADANPRGRERSIPITERDQHAAQRWQTHGAGLRLEGPSHIGSAAATDVNRGPIGERQRG
jgi:hypothetical protein